MRAFVTWKRDADYYASGDWRGKKATEGGGVLINQALHTLDLMNMLGGGVKAVTAHCSNDHLRGIIEVEDTVSVFAEFSRGFRGVFFATTANAVTSPIILEANFADRSIRIEGDSVFEQKDGKLTPVLDADSFVNHGKACWGSGHAALIRDFYESVTNKRPFSIDADEGGKAIELLLAIYKSAEKDERIEL